MASKFSDEDDALLDALGVEVEQPHKASRTPREERIIAGFEEIQRFVDEHGRAPLHGEDRDIFERLYAVRLDRIRQLAECSDLLRGMDRQGLLAPVDDMPGPEDDEALLAALGVEPGETDAVNITQLRHVRSVEEKRAAEDVAAREPCKDFERFKPFFEQVQEELDSGIRQTRPFEVKAEIEQGRFFIVSGQKAYVAEKGEPFANPQGTMDARLRVVFDNGTESNLLMRSLQKALNRDKAGRRITDPVAGPLFAATADVADTETGTIYVLRSKADIPQIAENRDLIHKIGVTGGSVESRIGNARLDATFLLADVEIVGTFTLYNINRTKLENLLHRIFAPARLDIEIADRFGNPVRPREWFLVPLAAVAKAVQLIESRKITEFHYSPEDADLVPRK